MLWIILEHVRSWTLRVTGLMIMTMKATATATTTTTIQYWACYCYCCYCCVAVSAAALLLAALSHCVLCSSVECLLRMCRTYVTSGYWVSACDVTQLKLLTSLSCDVTSATQTATQTDIQGKRVTKRSSWTICCCLALQWCQRSPFNTQVRHSTISLFTCTNRILIVRRFSICRAL